MIHFNIYFWKEINPNLTYKHKEQVLTIYLHEVIDYFLSIDYNVMIRKVDGNVVLFVDKGRFIQS